MTHIHYLPTFFKFGTERDEQTLNLPNVQSNIQGLAHWLGADRVYIEKPVTTWGGERHLVARFKQKGKTIKTRTVALLARG